MIVAGIGSRFLAGMLDVFLEAVLLTIVVTTFGALNLNHGFGLALLFVVVFVILFGFHLLFEVLNQGRTPGKAAAGLRVVKITGDPVDTSASAIRNLLRLVDGWMIVTAVLAPIGIVCAFVTRHSQRLGDLAAGTVVVRERFGPTGRAAASQLTTPVPASLDWDTGGLTDDEVLVISRFLERRAALPPNARIHLGREVADRFRSRIPGTNPTLADEQFLEWVLARRQGRA